MTIINLSQSLDMDSAIVSDILYFRKEISETFLRELSQFLPLTENLMNEEDLLRLLDCHGYMYLKEQSIVVKKDNLGVR
ncbi:hypothetical protein [Lactococcus allomyrinae]|uniref:Uncharacterized protein n=1 Tax=Lactococcus allomyrinae TaxID=2419773 RepID=A0A387B998_9LACT|nr:hypothetical protein [Lactococcus allomyrinae]AYG00405.1 hypothetical protein D7I46_04445 [Lactococcus allomyrinae]